MKFEFVPIFDFPLKWQSIGWNYQIAELMIETDYQMEIKSGSWMLSEEKIILLPSLF